MSVVVAHDYATQKGGEERLAIPHYRRALRSTAGHSLYDKRSSIPGFSRPEVQISFLQGVPAFRRDPGWRSLSLPCLVATPAQRGGRGGRVGAGVWPPDAPAA